MTLIVVSLQCNKVFEDFCIVLGYPPGNAIPEIHFESKISVLSNV